MFCRNYKLALNKTRTAVQILKNNHLFSESGHVGGDGGRRDVGNVVERGDRLLLEHAEVLPLRVGGTRGASEDTGNSLHLDHVGLSAGNELSQSRVLLLSG